MRSRQDSTGKRNQPATMDLIDVWIGALRRAKRARHEARGRETINPPNLRRSTCVSSPDSIPSRGSVIYLCIQIPGELCFSTNVYPRRSQTRISRHPAPVHSICTCPVKIVGTVSPVSSHVPPIPETRDSKISMPETAVPCPAWCQG